jgi:hypothetical protein
VRKIKQKKKQETHDKAHENNLSKRQGKKKKFREEPKEADLT